MIRTPPPPYREKNKYFFLKSKTGTLPLFTQHLITKMTQIFFSDIHSKVLRSVRITFFLSYTLVFSDCCFSALLLKFFWADSKINDAKFNQNKKHYLDVTPKKQLLIPNCCLFFCVLKQCFAILFILLAHNPPPWKILLWNWSK